MTHETNMFAHFLLTAYNEVSTENKTLYVRVEDVRNRLGISKELLEKRITEIWKAQFTGECNYALSLEADLSPLESWRLRKKKIMVDGFPANIMQMKLVA